MKFSLLFFIPTSCSPVRRVILTGLLLAPYPLVELIALSCPLQGCARAFFPSLSLTDLFVYHRINTEKACSCVIFSIVSKW